MRAAAILGLGCSPQNVASFQTDAGIQWRFNMPASSEDADVILLFGGDGTVHKYLGELVGLQLPVLIVPSGSGNDFARALGLSRVRDSLAAWRKFCAGHGNVRCIDLGIITPTSAVAGGGSARPALWQPGDARYFASVAGLGLSSEVARCANTLPRWLRGNGGYALSLPPVLFRYAPQQVKISTSQEGSGWIVSHHQPMMLMAFANTPTFGGGMKIAPRAVMNDGKLDLCLIQGMSRFKLASLFPTVYSGSHLDIREVNYFQAPRVRMETETPLDLYADGEYVCQTPLEVSVAPRALKVLTP